MLLSRGGTQSVRTHLPALSRDGARGVQHLRDSFIRKQSNLAPTGRMIPVIAVYSLAFSVGRSVDGVDFVIDPAAQEISGTLEEGQEPRLEVPDPRQLVVAVFVIFFG